MGVVLSMALLLGLPRGDAVRFAFLLAIPVIFFAGIYELSNAVGVYQAVDWKLLVVGFFTSAAVAFITIYLFAHAIEKIGLVPFVVYRIILGAVILLLV